MHRHIAVIAIRALAAAALIVLLTGCGQTAQLRLIGALSYANTYASNPGLLLDEFKSRFTDPFVLETVPSKTLVERIETGRTEGAAIREVPFFMQGEYGCGPAALAGVLGFHGVNADPKEIARQVVVPEIGGTLCTDMVAYPRTRGLWSEQHLGSPGLLRKHIGGGRPVVCLLGTGAIGFAGHYIIVTACAPGEGVVCHDGKRANAFLPWREFEALWNAGRRWMLVACPPEDVNWQLPSRLKNELGRLLHERGQLEKALAQYEASFEAQKTDRARARVKYNIGLSLFGLGRLKEAQESFGKALEFDPELPDASNGLAYTLATLGTNLDEAEQLTRKALESAGANRALYMDTLGYVLHRLGKDNEAVMTLREALENIGGDVELEAEISYHLGLACGNDPEERTLFLKKAVELSPESPSGRRAAALLEKEKKGRSPVDERKSGG